MDIDLVYCWCGVPKTDVCDYVDDLIWSIRSVRKFMPWIRYIIVALDDAFLTSPQRSVLENKWGRDVRIVPHSAFMPKKYLKDQRNSNVIESWIWKIDGLSECFVYMNDDMYVGQPVESSTFFNEAKMPILRHEPGPPFHHRSFNRLTLEQKRIPYVRMWSHAHDEYGLEFTRTAHTAQPYRVSILADLYRTWKSKVNESSMNKIRMGELDFNLLRFSGPMAVQQGHALLRVTYDDFDYFTESNDKPRIRKILKVRPTFFCVNNTGPKDKHVIRMLEKYFSE